MEAFGVAAVSLTLQLAGNIETIKQSWRDVKSATKEFGYIIRELELLKRIIEGLRRAHGPDPFQVASVLAALHRAMAKRRLLTAFKTALKKAMIVDFSRHTGQGKKTLLLAISVPKFCCRKHAQSEFGSSSATCALISNAVLFRNPSNPEEDRSRASCQEDVPPQKRASAHRQMSISEHNYRSIVRTWNAIMLTDEPVSSDVTVTLLQGPLRISRLESHSPDVKNQEDAKYSTTLLLLCIYFFTRQDPRGHKIAWATLRRRAMSEPVEFWEHVGRYWDGAQRR